MAYIKNFLGDLSISGYHCFYLTLVFLVFFVFFPNLIWLLVDNSPKNLLSEMFIPAFLAIAMLFSLSRRVWVGVILLAPWALLSPFESYYIFDFEKYSDAHLFGIISDSDFAEVSAFISGISGGLFALSSIGGFLVITALCLAFKFRIVWEGRSRRWIFVASIFGLIFPELINLNGPVRSLQIQRHQTTEQEIGVSLADDHWPKIFDYLMPVYPIGVPERIYVYLGQRRALRVAKDKLEGFRFHAKQDPVPHREVHVLVIGETGRPDHWQLNGYPRQTNPHLALVTNLYSYKNAFSPWAWTRMAVPLILTRKSPLDVNQFFSERSLVSAFREAGFSTYWLSTQSPLGPHDSSIALHAAEANEARFLNPLDYKSAGLFDGVLLKPLDEIISRGEQKILIVLHILGGHFNYADRYPNDYDIFKPSLKGVVKPSLLNPDLRARFANSYDNSLLYLDFFLSEIIRRLSATNALATMFYMADHGENLFDGNCDKAGHGRGNEYDFRVAAMWWSSEKFAATFKEKKENAKSHTDSPITTSNVFHSMLDVANIRYPEENLAMSIFSRNFRPSIRITQDKINFDLAIRDGQCKKLVAEVRSEP